MQDDPHTVTIPWDQARELAQDIDPEEYDEAVVNFLDELLSPQPDYVLLQQASTMLLQDEIDLPPSLRESGVEPDELLIELFVTAGADLNARNAYGETPLGLAARYGYDELVSYLLSRGASRERTNAQGQIAADLASTPALIDALMPEARKGLDELVEQPDSSSAAVLPDYIEDADIVPPTELDDILDALEAKNDVQEDARFAPSHDCGLGSARPPKRRL